MRPAASRQPPIVSCRPVVAPCGPRR
jgi:hypothetical protein